MMVDHAGSPIEAFVKSYIQFYSTELGSLSRHHLGGLCSAYKATAVRL